MASQIPATPHPPHLIIIEPGFGLPRLFAQRPRLSVAFNWLGIIVFFLGGDAKKKKKKKTLDGTKAAQHNCKSCFVCVCCVVQLDFTMMFGYFGDERERKYVSIFIYFFQFPLFLFALRQKNLHICYLVRKDISPEFGPQGNTKPHWSGREGVGPLHSLVATTTVGHSLKIILIIQSFIGGIIFFKICY